MNNSAFQKTLLRGKKILRDKSQQIDFLVQNLPDPFVIADFNGYILDINPAFEKVYGWKKKEIIQKYIPMVLPRLTTEFFAFLTKIRQSEKASGYETTRIRKDRSEIMVSIDAFPLVNQKGEPMGIGEISRDITHLKREETISKEFQEKWKTLAHNAPHLIITIDRQGGITLVNQRIKQLLGYDVEEVINSPLSTLVIEEDLEVVKKDLIEVITKDETKSCVYRLKKKDGLIATYALDWSSLKEPSGKIKGAVGIGRDITREKEKEQELIQSQRLQALADLVGGIAHHFNNLMTIILLQAQLIDEEKKKPGNKVIEKRLKLIRESCFQGKKKVDQILQFVEGLSGREFLMVDINRLIKEALSDASVQLEAKAIQVNTKWSDLPSVLGCSRELRKALVELFINAVEAMPQEGKLDIKTGKKRDSVYISIADSGTGMSEDVQKKIFEPFFTTKEATRSGLGATLAYGIVKKHGGEIKVFSTLKRGTTFIIKLPTELMPRPHPPRPHLGIPAK